MRCLVVVVYENDVWTTTQAHLHRVARSKHLLLPPADIAQLEERFLYGRGCGFESCCWHEPVERSFRRLTDQFTGRGAQNNANEIVSILFRKELKIWDAMVV